jgi:competence protein ComEC
MLRSPTARNFNRHAMLVLAVCFACGIILGRAGALGISGATVIAICLIVFCFMRRSIALFAAPLIFIPLGTFCHEIETRSIADDRIRRIYSDGRIKSAEPVEIEGTLLRVPEPAYGGYFLTLRVDRLVFRTTGQTASGNVRLFAPAENDATAGELDRLGLRYGSRVRIACRLEREDRYLNPGVASRIGILDQQGIDAVATIKSPLLIEKLGDEPVFIPLAWAYDVRQHLIGAFRANFSAETAGVLIASLLGDKHFLDRGTAEAFREGGTFHVLVISGLHITFIGGLTLWAISFVTGRTLLQATLASSLLWAYTFAVGAEIPVVRASLMFSFLLISTVIYRQSELLNALGTCTLLLLVWRPSDLLSASFQLTVVSVAAIVGCAFPLIKKLRAIGSWTPTHVEPLPPNTTTLVRRVCETLYWNEAEWNIDNKRQVWSANLFKSPYLKLLTVPNLKAIAAYVFEGLLVSVIVQIWMLPLLVIYFHRVSPLGIVLNLWVGVFLAMESFSAVAAVIVNSISLWMAAPLIAMTEIFNRMMMAMPVWFSRAGVADLRVPIYTGGYASVYYVYGATVVIAAVELFKWDPFSLRRERPSRLAVTYLGLVAVCAVIILVHPFSSPRPEGRLKIDFLDVGQGDSALVTFSNGVTMLVDGGGRVDYREDGPDRFEPDLPRIGESAVSEFLWEKGYSHIDYLVATHADADHIQGLADVARNFSIGSLIVGVVPESDRDFDEVLAVAQRNKIGVVSVRRGDNIDIGGVAVQVLNPPRDERSRSNTANDSSIVLRITFAARTFLLTGDIEREAERALVADETINLFADVAKVPHHGSRTSSTDSFVDNVRANTAVISVGRRSRFGHPHDEVVKRWRGAGAMVQTTGERGTITVETDGHDLLIRTFKP